MTPEETLAAYLGAGPDLDATLSHVADDAVYLFSNGSQHVGKDAVRAAIQRNFDAIKLDTYAISDERWLVRADDAAVCVFNFAWSGLIDGRPASGSGRGTCALRREGDRWRIAHEHLSRGDPLPPIQPNGT